MPLEDGYGVVMGTLQHYYRDPVNNYGQYYHGNVMVQTPQGIYHCAIDVDCHSQPNGVEWRVVPLGWSDLNGLTGLSDGWHGLLSNETSGAIDYIRTRDFRRRLGCWIFFLPIYLPRYLLKILWQILQVISPPWKQGTSIDALADLEPLLQASTRLFIFGEPFTDGLGVHNIHQNQGDPAGSQWWAENGIWQDGGTLMQLGDGSICAFLNKFKTQSYETDDNGHPI